MEYKKPIKSDPILRFTPYAYAKLLFMRDVGETEVGGYGITGTEDPMLVTDFALVKQECTMASVELDEEDSGLFAEKMLDVGLAPWQTGNIWIHTHPGDCPKPSKTDEENFVKNFGHPHWSIMYILAEGGKDYCRIKFNVGPGFESKLDVQIDYSIPFNGTNKDEWEKEYDEKVIECKIAGFSATKIETFTPYSNDYCDRFQTMKTYKDPQAELARMGYSDEEIANLTDKAVIDLADGKVVVDEDDDFIDLDIYTANGVVWYWHDKKNEYVVYDPVENTFRWEDSGKLVKGEKDWMDDVREWADNHANIVKSGEFYEQSR